MRIHLLENAVDIASTVDFSKNSVEIDRQCGFIPKKKSIGTDRRCALIPKKNRSTVDIDRRSGLGLKKIVKIDLTLSRYTTGKRASEESRTLRDSYCMEKHF